MPLFLRPLLLATMCALAAAPARAGSVAISVTDAAGKPLPDAVALLEPVAARPAVKPMPDAEVAQAKRRFQPRVTLVTVGTRVNFPNFDTVRHHVYSFSAAKTFELKLYAGVPAEPVLFDKPGIAVLGCNIHDRMAAWIVVADTPYAARSDADGRLRVDGVPPGDYRLTLWHPGLAGANPPAPQPLAVPAGELQHAARLALGTEP